MRILALLSLCAVLVAGCASRDPATPAEITQTTTTASDPWNGSTNQTLVHLDENGTTQADILCVGGGGVNIQRDEGLVLPGSKNLHFNIMAPPTATGVQVGYALSRDPGYDERAQGNITWLPIVRNEEKSFEVAVPNGTYESSPDDRLWAFYLRMNTEATDCFTGAQVQGRLVIDVQAVKGEA